MKELHCNECGEIMGFTKGYSTDADLHYCINCGVKEAFITYDEPRVVATGKPVKRNQSPIDKRIAELEGTLKAINVAKDSCKKLQKALK